MPINVWKLIAVDRHNMYSIVSFFPYIICTTLCSMQQINYIHNVAQMQLISYTLRRHMTTLDAPKLSATPLIKLICHSNAVGLDIAHLCTKFNDCSLSRSRDMVGAHQNLNGSHDLTTPLSGWFGIRGLALATIGPSTKFEVSIASHHVDMTGDTKCRKWGGVG